MPESLSASLYQDYIKYFISSLDTAMGNQGLIIQHYEIFIIN